MKFRRVERPHGWTSIPNAMLEDRSLSWRARGLLAYLLSRPTVWETDSERLAQQGREGRDAVRTALRELEDARYLFRVKSQGSDGRWTTDYVVYDHPLEKGSTPGSEAPMLPLNTGDNPVDNPVEDGGKPTPENPSPGPGKPTPENPALLTTTEEQLDQDFPTQPHEGGAIAPGDKSVVGSAAAASPGSPSGLAGRGVELTLDPDSAAAIGAVQAGMPGVDMFALRAHLVTVEGDAPSFPHIARHLAELAALMPAWSDRRVTTDMVLHASIALVTSSALVAVSSAEESSGSAARSQAALPGGQAAAPAAARLRR